MSQYLEVLSKKLRRLCFKCKTHFHENEVADLLVKFEKVLANICYRSCEGQGGGGYFFLANTVIRILLNFWSTFSDVARPYCVGDHGCSDSVQTSIKNKEFLPFLSTNIQGGRALLP